MACCSLDSPIDNPYILAFRLPGERVENSEREETLGFDSAMMGVFVSRGPDKKK